MSSLRVDSVRLCWIEAFVEVANAENISAAAKELGISQPTVSRYVQSLEAWLGKQLIEPGGISDPEQPRLSVAVTEHGREFFEIAVETISTLHAVRTPAARATEQLSPMRLMIGKMHSDLSSNDPSAFAQKLRDKILLYKGLVDALNESAPLEALTVLNRQLRYLFIDYEEAKKQAARRARKRRVGGIDPKALDL